jgi:PAS domain S-box-containing protein
VVQPSSRKGQLLSRWPLWLALALAFYSALLLAYADASSRQRLADTNAWLVGDSQRRAQALADLLSELHASAAAHADVPEVHAYLASRDLGMSPRYGLNAARGAIEARLHQKAEDSARRWGVAPPRVVHYSGTHEVLADTAPGSALPLPQVPNHPQGLRIDLDRGTIEHAVPVQHKGLTDGMVVTVSSLDALYRNLLQPGHSANNGHHELLLGQDGRLPPGRGQELQLGSNQLQVLRSAPDNQALETATQLATASTPPLLDDTVMIKTQVPNAPLLLITFVPRDLAYGHLQSRTLTLGGGVLLLLLLAGAFRLDNMRRKALQLTQDIAAAEQQRSLTEFRNRELSDEITRREAVERALAESERRWQLAVAGTNDGIWDWNIATGELFMSDRWLGMLGYRSGDLAASAGAWNDLLHPDDRAQTMACLNAHLAGASPFYETEFRLRCADGSYRWILGRGKAQFDGQGQPERMTGSHSDVTERRTAAARLRDHTEQLNAIFELSPDGFVSFDAERRVRFVNRAFQALTGLEEAALLGLDEDDFSRRLASRGPQGLAFPGVAALRAACGFDAPPEARQASEHKAPTRLSFQLLGPPARVLEVGVQRAAAANVSQVLYLRDITRDTEVDRMKSEFLSTAAHELRTPMTSIFGFVQLLRLREMDGPKRREILDTIARQSDLMMAIINQLLDLARIEARQGSDFVLEHVALQDVVGSSVADYRPPSGRVAPTVDADGPPLLVEVDRQKLQQAVLNILSNAYKYSPQGGEVRLRYRAEPGPAGLRHGVSVRDQGIGMTAEQVAHVCERFYRADASGNIPGTGLGMSIVKEIVELHRGEVQFDSAPAQGTEVTLWLPAASSPCRPLATAEGP